jgi:hypothetical protein
MKHDRIEEGRLSADGQGLGTVTEEMVLQRAREIAFINGRSKKNVLDSDLAQARRELTGEEHLVPEPTKAETLPEEERWDPVPGSTGRKVPTVRAPDEQTTTEELVEEGVEDAEHDQMVRATKQGLKKDLQE